MGNPVSVVDQAIVHGRQSWTMAETIIPAAGVSVPGARIIKRSGKR
jgi:hypothetical protein